MRAQEVQQDPLRGVLLHRTVEGGDGICFRDLTIGTQRAALGSLQQEAGQGGGEEVPNKGVDSSSEPQPRISSHIL